MYLNHSRDHDREFRLVCKVGLSVTDPPISRLTLGVLTQLNKTADDKRTLAVHHLRYLRESARSPDGVMPVAIC